MIDPKVQFFFYLVAVGCLLTAAWGEGQKLFRPSKTAMPALGAFAPLGVALWLFPLMWNTGYGSFS